MPPETFPLVLKVVNALRNGFDLGRNCGHAHKREYLTLRKQGFRTKLIWKDAIVQNNFSLEKCYKTRNRCRKSIFIQEDLNAGHILRFVRDLSTLGYCAAMDIPEYWLMVISTFYFETKNYCDICQLHTEAMSTAQNQLHTQNARL